MNSERNRIIREVFHKSNEVIQEPLKEVSNNIEVNPEISPRLLRLFSEKRLKKIKAKELRRYGDALEKKWRNWFISMSE